MIYIVGIILGTLTLCALIVGYPELLKLYHKRVVPKSLSDSLGRVSRKQLLGYFSSEQVQKMIYATGTGTHEQRFLSELHREIKVREVVEAEIEKAIAETTYTPKRIIGRKLV